MNLLTKTLKYQLLCNWRASDEAGLDSPDFQPVVKFFFPLGSATWLFTELNPADEDTLFGLCDPGLGCPELGYQSLQEIEAYCGPAGLRIERDLHFKADKTLSQYAEEARIAGRIVT
jgi:hypothetical protein